MTVSLDEFLRRFLLHLLPKGFVRIRHATAAMLRSPGHLSIGQRDQTMIGDGYAVSVAAMEETQKQPPLLPRLR